MPWTKHPGCFFCPTRGAQRLGWSQGKLQKSTLKPVPKLRHPPGVVELVSPGVHLLPRLKTPAPFPKPRIGGNEASLTNIWVVGFKHFLCLPPIFGAKDPIWWACFFQMGGFNHQVDSGVVVTLCFFWCWIDKCVWKTKQVFMNHYV